MPNHPPIPKETPQDYDALLERMMPMIEEWLAELDGFIPCGAVITTDGELVGHLVGVDNATTTESAMYMLYTGFKSQAQARQIRACCACYDGSFEQDGRNVSAVTIVLDHLGGPATTLRRPYKKLPRGGYEYRQIISEQFPTDVFAGL